MTLAELRERLRSVVLDDAAEPYLWTDAFLSQALNEAIQEAAIRSRMFTRSFDISMPIGYSTHDLPGDVIEVRRVKPEGRRALMPTSIEQLDNSGNWQSRSGAPGWFVAGSRMLGFDNQILIYPSPQEVTTITVTADVVPPAMVEEGDECPYPLNLQAKLLHWAGYLAFSMRDADAQDQARAAKHEEQFADAFGYRHDAAAEKKRADRKPHTVRMNEDWR